MNTWDLFFHLDDTGVGARAKHELRPEVSRDSRVHEPFAHGCAVDGNLPEVLFVIGVGHEVVPTRHAVVAEKHGNVAAFAS